MKSMLESSFSNFQIREIGFKLDQETRKILLKHLDSLENRSPVLSNLRLTFINEGKKIKGSLLILSMEKAFRASWIGDDPLTIYEFLEKDIDHQLKVWKKEHLPKVHAGRKHSQLTA